VTIRDEDRQRLVEAAVQARRWAYAPYSHYAVGAAVLTDSGKLYDGVNVENAAYPAGICAERVALFKAISEGERNFLALAVATSNGGTPCGSCRQVMAEFGIDMLVLVADSNGVVVAEQAVADLLPGAFLPGDLPRG
jgi:cytidine deaminase